MFTRQQKDYLENLEIMSSLGDTGEDECIKMMDFQQSSLEEIHALETLVHFDMNNKYVGEWYTPQWILVSDGMAMDEYHKLLDEAEMSRDMDAWEDAFACHQLFAKNPWFYRKVGIITKDGEVNKRSESKFWCEVTNVGDSYHTAESDYGKVFIPKFLGIQDASVGDMMYIGASFQGFESARKTAMPWRAKYISIIQIQN
jgi:hypothetical protein